MEKSSERIECAFDSDRGLVPGWAGSLIWYFGIRYDCNSFDVEKSSTVVLERNRVFLQLSYGRGDKRGHRALGKVALDSQEACVCRDAVYFACP